MKKPNILFVLTDDQGAWALECAGKKDIQTPALDSLAEQGVLFDNFYCASSVCSPARASLVTGKIPSAHGVQEWISQGNMDAWKYPEMGERKHSVKGTGQLDRCYKENAFNQRMEFYYPLIQKGGEGYAKK